MFEMLPDPAADDMMEWDLVQQDIADSVSSLNAKLDAAWKVCPPDVSGYVNNMRDFGRRLTNVAVRLVNHHTSGTGQ